MFNQTNAAFYEYPNRPETYDSAQQSWYMRCCNCNISGLRYGIAHAKYSSCWVFSQPGSPLVWVLWVLQHPLFSKLWLLAPTLFVKFSSDTLSKWGKKCKKLFWCFGKVIPSTHAFKFLAGTLKFINDISSIALNKTDQFGSYV